MITGYRGAESNLVLPETVEGYTVSGLGESFSVRTASVKNLRCITIPNTITTIEPGAFRFAEYLTEIVDNFDGLGISELEIPESVKRIERSFSTLMNLTEVVIPGSVNTISRNSFSFCKNLASITIPAGVTDIGSSFAGCAGTLVIRVEPGSFAEQYCRDHQLNYEYIPE